MPPPCHLPIRHAAGNAAALWDEWTVRALGHAAADSARPLDESRWFKDMAAASKEVLQLASSSSPAPRPTVCALPTTMLLSVSDTLKHGRAQFGGNQCRRRRSRPRGKNGKKRIRHL